MQPYLDLMRHVLENGTDKSDRTGTGTRSVFGWQMRFDLARGFPVMTTKKLHLKSIIHELLWFLQGDTNIRYLKENGVRIWDEWADENGDLGPVYGHQWRHWKTPDGREIDQIVQLIDGLKNNPDSRRHIVTAWNPSDVDSMALPPCHAFFQLYVAPAALDEIAAHERAEGKRPGDVLVFLPGEREIREAAEVLRKANLRLTEVLPLYARLTPAEQQKIFAPMGARKIVLATNVAETSLTVPDRKSVV